MTTTPESPRIENYFRILQVSPYATPGAIHDAYRMVSIRLRSTADQSPGVAAMLRKVEEAYAVLSDDFKRAAYEAEFARQSASGDLNDAFSLCPACEEMSRKLYVRRAPPCEWCDRFAITCAARPDNPDDSEHVWLCERCFNDLYLRT